jgi:hypothetical protein
MNTNQTADGGVKAIEAREKAAKMLQRRFNIAPMMDGTD